MASAILSPSATANLEPGDRFEVQVAQEGRGLLLPPHFPELGSLNVEIEAGQPIEAVPEKIGLLHVPGLAELLAHPWEAVWLEYREPGRMRLVIESPDAAQSQGEVVTEQGVHIALDADDVARLRDGSRPSASLGEFDIALRAALLTSHAGFDQLICLPLVRDMEILEHQVRTAKTVLRRLRGRALLCDEVGLGKTIEAGLVLSELCLRGLARSILVLVPPSLIEQWQGEMLRKFNIELISHDDPGFRQRGSAGWGEVERVIASCHTAKREPHRSAILGRKWDLVIVDEAHHLRNRSTQLWRFASEIQKQFILLLTATPVQNNLEELFNLVTLLEPGLLSTAKQFQKQFVDRKDKLTPRNVDELHRLLSEVMVRNRRSTVGLQFTRRWVRTERVTMTPAEHDLYGAAADFVRQHLRSGDSPGPLARIALLSLQMALGSSSQAAAGTLARLVENPSLPKEIHEPLVELAQRARAQTESAKVNRLLDILREF
ncbi:MAG TPA: DEAD/DEAH box helicase, partial [Gemmataceae bacterium]|nr:DEAD/DEAH box helicase [Gemmataceae bacterium]